jgi:hypothetical protein
MLDDGTKNDRNGAARYNGQQYQEADYSGEEYEYEVQQ